MHNIDAEIANLKQEMALLKKQQARSEAKLLACLIGANAQLLAAQTDLVIARDELKKDKTARAADRAALDDVLTSDFKAVWQRLRALDKAIAEVQLFIGPVVDKLFPDLLKKYVAIGERFKATGSFEEFKRD